MTITPTTVLASNRCAVAAQRPRRPRRRLGRRRGAASATRRCRSDALAVEDTAHVGHLVLLVCGLAVLDDPHLETFDLGEAQSVVELGVSSGSP
jgi:hypothetical protein